MENTSKNEILKKLLPFVIALVALLVGGAIGAAITWNVTSSNPTYVEDQEMTLGLKSGKKTGTYTGEVKDGTPNGTGTFTCKAKDDSGFTYSGQWKNGHINGYGFMEKQTGEKYVGSYKDDYVSDYGVLTMATGDVYCGQMDKSVTMKGKGILCLDGDSYFSGIFSDLYHGVGTQCDDNTLKTGTMTDRTTFVSDEEQKKRDEQEAAEKKAAEEQAKKEAEEKKKKEEAERKKKEEEEKKGYNTGITYDQLARTPDDYEGKKVKFSGEVVQVVEGDFMTAIRLAVNGDYDNMLYCTYISSITSSRVLENDTITIMGTSGGLYSYESTIGATITIPSVDVDKIEQ